VSSGPRADEVLDCRGSACPLPVVRTAQAIDLGVRLHPRRMTMDPYCLTEADFVDGIEPTVGATTFIDRAVEADITLSS
jgi:peroxiredoxin family protein